MAPSSPTMENDRSVRDWLTALELSHPLLIAGPCSAETEQQVLETAAALAGTQVRFFRAGIWKPRTRPGGFEGVGAHGLKWLQKAKAEFGFPLAVEVANATHVKIALDHDIDLLWIGARTTVNPFAVQEIADALAGSDKIVLVKNPVNPDLALWMGGIERIYQAGVRNLGAVHRGFSTYEKTTYRNIPEWQIPIELKSRLPHLPLLCDPSHITGRRDMIAEVSQQALDLTYDGLMIETHPRPDEAWSDAAQQVTPERLKAIFDELHLRKKESTQETFVAEIDALRSRIDLADAKLLEVLGKRMRIAEEIGQLKKAQDVAILQNERWVDVKKKMMREGAQKGLTQEFILQLFKAIHEESIAHQQMIMNPGDGTK